MIMPCWHSGSIDAFIQLTTGRARFERELCRGKALNFFCVVVEAALKDIILVSFISCPFSTILTRNRLFIEGIVPFDPVKRFDQIGRLILPQDE
jgi:hypothetical protein